MQGGLSHIAYHQSKNPFVKQSLDKKTIGIRGKKQPSMQKTGRLRWSKPGWAYCRRPRGTEDNEIREMKKKKNKTVGKRMGANGRG